MKAIGQSEVFVVAALLALMWSGKSLYEIARSLAEAIHRFGGPGSPGHPLPSNDGAILNRKRTKQTSEVL